MFTKKYSALETSEQLFEVGDMVASDKTCQIGERYKYGSNKSQIGKCMVVDVKDIFGKPSYSLQSLQNGMYLELSDGCTSEVRGIGPIGPIDSNLTLADFKVIEKAQGNKYIPGAGIRYSHLADIYNPSLEEKFRKQMKQKAKEHRLFQIEKERELSEKLAEQDRQALREIQRTTLGIQLGAVSAHLNSGLSSESARAVIGLAHDLAILNVEHHYKLDAPTKAALASHKTEDRYVPA